MYSILNILYSYILNCYHKGLFPPNMVDKKLTNTNVATLYKVLV